MNFGATDSWVFPWGPQSTREDDGDDYDAYREGSTLPWMEGNHTHSSSLHSFPHHPYTTAGPLPLPQEGDEDDDEDEGEGPFPAAAEANLEQMLRFYDDDPLRILSSASRLRSAPRSALCFPLGHSSGGGGGTAERSTAHAAHLHHLLASSATANTPGFAPQLTSQSYSIAAIIHSGPRSKEVGVALCQLPSLVISLAQFSDSSGYNKCVALLASRDLVEVVLPLTAIRSSLASTLLRQLPEDVTFTGLQRCLFHCERGVRRLLEVESSTQTSSASSSSAIHGLLQNSDRYLSAAAAHALLCYLESLHDVTFLPHSLSVRFLSLDSFVEVSRATARTLHVIAPTHTTTSHHVSTLMEAMPRAVTPTGQRWLRSAILQPLRERVDIECRYDVVAWLLQAPHRLFELRQALCGTSHVDLDRLCSELSVDSRGRGRPDGDGGGQRAAPLAPAREMTYLRSRIRLLMDCWDAVVQCERLRERLESMLPSTEVPAVSTPEHPLLLGSVLCALRACELPALRACLETYVDPTVVKQQENRVPAKRMTKSNSGKRGRAGGGVEAGVSAGMGLHSRRDVFPLLRLSFTIYATSTHSSLAVSRQHLSGLLQQVSMYYESLKMQSGLHSLQLEPDSGGRLYCFSYSSCEAHKARGVPFTYLHCTSSHQSSVAASLRLWRQAGGGGEEQGAPPGEGEPDAAGPSLSSLSQPSEKKRKAVRMRCSTAELDSLSDAASECVRSILREEVQAAAPLFQQLQHRIGRLQALSESIALLDALMSFATYSRSHRCQRPTLLLPQEGQQERITLTCARYPAGMRVAQDHDPGSSSSGGGGATSSRKTHRHRRHDPRTSSATPAPLPSALALASEEVPNTVCWEAGVRTLILTGPNMSGKTTLLRVVGQLYMLAQSGCFIPVADPAAGDGSSIGCSSTTMRLVTSILAHITVDDLPCVTQSSFKRELLQLGEVCRAAGPHSLVLLDELGRSTTTTEGFTLAWATALYLRRVGCQCISTTHFTGLTALSELYSDIAQIHFTLSSSTRQVKHRSITSYTHQLLPGLGRAAKGERYGLELARRLHLLPSVVDGAERLLNLEGKAQEIARLRGQQGGGGVPLRVGDENSEGAVSAARGP